MKLLFFASLMTLSTSLTFAKSPAGPQFEPGPTKTLSSDAAEISRVLLNPRLKDCIKKFQEDDVAIISVERQMLSPDSRMYTISGVTLMGGDIATGSATLLITGKDIQGPGFGTTTVYTCTYTKR